MVRDIRKFYQRLLTTVHEADRKKKNLLRFAYKKNSQMRENNKKR